MNQAAPCSSALFPTAHDRDRGEAWLSRTLRASRARVAAGRVAPASDRPALTRQLANFDFDEPQPAETIVPWLIDQLEHGITQTTHPRYFGLFNPAPSFPAECAERIVAQFNPQLASATTAPAAVAIEAHVIRAVGRQAGLGQNTAGHFTTGGSEANFTALICALTAAEPDYTESGLRAFAERPLFYVSRECHLAWLKIAVQAGLGRAAMRLVATDPAGRMDPAALTAAIAQDRAAGGRPIMVVATAGTTGAGMIDPIAACARIAETNGAWLHVDAAWGGGLIASPRLRPALDGIALAHSVTIDAHKWFATTMGCGMFLTREPAMLARAFAVAAVFMPSNDRDRDPYVNSVQWSRRFLGLRLFLSLAVAGWDGFSAHIEHAVALAALLRAALVERGWIVLNDSVMAVLCVAPPPGFPDARAIVQRVVGSGIAWVSVTHHAGRDAVRACITHGQTTPDDVMTLVQALHACGPVGAPEQDDTAALSAERRLQPA